MADFSVVMRNMARMCKAYWPDGDDECMQDCPLYSTWCLNMDNDYPQFNRSQLEMGQVEAAVIEWAAENPEPVYPTWYEWLHSLSIAKFDTSHEAWALGEKYRETSKDVPGVWVLTNFAKAPIPADIAQKLGIEPKEG